MVTEVPDSTDKEKRAELYSEMKISKFGESSAKKRKVNLSSSDENIDKKSVRKSERSEKVEDMESSIILHQYKPS